MYVKHLVPDDTTWICVKDKLPTPEDCFNTEVIGWVAPYGIVKNGEPDFVHFDGEDWHDRGCRTCTVTHWKPLNCPIKEV